MALEQLKNVASVEMFRKLPKVGDTVYRIDIDISACRDCASLYILPGVCCKCLDGYPYYQQISCLKAPICPRHKFVVREHEVGKDRINNYGIGYARRYWAKFVFADRPTAEAQLAKLEEARR